MKNKNLIIGKLYRLNYKILIHNDINLSKSIGLLSYDNIFIFLEKIYPNSFMSFYKILYKDKIGYLYSSLLKQSKINESNFELIE